MLDQGQPEISLVLVEHNGDMVGTGRLGSRSFSPAGRRAVSYLHPVPSPDVGSAQAQHDEMDGEAQRAITCESRLTPAQRHMS